MSKVTQLEGGRPKIRTDPGQLSDTNILDHRAHGLPLVLPMRILLASSNSLKPNLPQGVRILTTPESFLHSLGRIHLSLSPYTAIIFRDKIGRALYRHERMNRKKCFVQGDARDQW